MIYSPKITVKFFSLLPRLPLSRCEKEGKVAQKRGGRKKTEKKRRNDRYCGSNSKRWGSNIQAAVRGCFGRKTKKGRNTRGKIFFETCETGDNKYGGGGLTSLLVRKVENNRSMNRNGWADYQFYQCPQPGNYEFRARSGVLLIIVACVISFQSYNLVDRSHVYKLTLSFSFFLCVKRFRGKTIFYSLVKTLKR